MPLLGQFGTWRSWHEELLRLSGTALVLTAFLEAFVGRALSRAAPLIPRGPATTALFEGLGQSGVFLFNLGTILVFLVLGLLLWSLRIRVRRLPFAHESLSAVALAFLLLSAGSFVVRDPVLLVALSTLFLAVSTGLVMTGAMTSRSVWSRAFAAFVTISYAASRYFVIASIAGELGEAPVGPAGGLIALWIAEAAATLAPVALFALTYRRTSARMPLWIPGLAAALFVIAVIANPAITAAIAEASLGFTLFLPFPVYAAGLWFAVSAFLLLWRDETTRAQAYGIALVMIAGIDLRLTYQTLLAVAGLLLWVLREERPRPTVATVAHTTPAPFPGRAVDSESAARTSR